jgi:hypothetical protein
MDKSNYIKQLLFGVILASLLAPFIQKTIHLIEIKPLQGAVTPPEDSYFKLQDWFNSTYQEKQETYIKETFGFREWFIRLNNQLAFSMFHEARANGVIVGKQNYLFEQNYISAYYGTDFIGEDSIRTQMHKLKVVSDSLHQLGKDLLLVFAAGKGSFYPEYFPENLKQKKRGKTNYQRHIYHAKKQQLNLIDFNAYFLRNKNKSPYPLYPQYGIHWSYYGMCLVADSLTRYIEYQRKVNLPHITWKKIEHDQPRDTDYDIAEGMNLVQTLKTFSMGYPKIRYKMPSNPNQVGLLVIADSFYWGLFNMGLSNQFNPGHFWFYNQEIYPDHYTTPTTTDQIDLRTELLKHDVIVLMATEATLPNFGWGFIEKAYNLFTQK